jgi:hypothetical protein
MYIIIMMILKVSKAYIPYVCCGKYKLKMNKIKLKTKTFNISFVGNKNTFY